MQKHLQQILIFFMLIVAAIFRFSYLSWGYPYFFHPDENNIMQAIGRLSLTQWNPHFFAYGGLPIYLAFLISSLISFGSKNFAVIGYTLRSISAILSFLIVPSLFFIGKRVFSPTVGFITALLATCSVGFIQFAHFGTFEMWLTFLTLWLFYYCFVLYKNPKRKTVIMTAILAGALVSVKVSSIVFLIIPLVILFLRKKHISFIANSFFYILIVCCIYLLTNPYLLLDTNSFISSLSYESSVALGTLPVFYTQSFANTTPLLFQFLRVFPFLLNPFVLMLFLLSLCILLMQWKSWKSSEYLLVIFLAIAIFSQAFLFVKWTRYMVPALPFMYLCIGYFISRLSSKKIISITVFFSLISLFYSILFFFTVYPTDSRIAAAVFAQKHFVGKQAIVEPYDLGALPFNSSLQGHIVNLYDLESDPIVQNDLFEKLNTSTVFLSESQRLLRSRMMNPTEFPQGHTLYTDLSNGTLGYKKVYQTPCSVWCTILYSGNPIYSVEETITTFDHPFVTIFAKQ